MGAYVDHLQCFPYVEKCKRCDAQTRKWRELEQLGTDYQSLVSDVLCCAKDVDEGFGDTLRDFSAGLSTEKRQLTSRVLTHPSACSVGTDDFRFSASIHGLASVSPELHQLRGTPLGGVSDRRERMRQVKTDSRRGERPRLVEEDRLRVTGPAAATPSEEKDAVADWGYGSGFEATRETGTEPLAWSGRMVDVDKPRRREPGRSEGGRLDALGSSSP